MLSRRPLDPVLIPRQVLGRGVDAVEANVSGGLHLNTALSEHHAHDIAVATKFTHDAGASGLGVLPGILFPGALSYQVGRP